jgi:N-methylhydantoinase A
MSAASPSDDPARAGIGRFATLLAAADLELTDISWTAGARHNGRHQPNRSTARRSRRAVGQAFRDVLEIGRSCMPVSFEFHADAEVPLARCDCVVEIVARRPASGRPSRKPVNMTVVAAAAALRTQAPDAIALTLISRDANSAQADFTM